MVAHQVGKAMEEAACGSKRTNAASRVVKPTGADYKHTFLEPRAQKVARRSRKSKIRRTKSEGNTTPEIPIERGMPVFAWDFLRIWCFGFWISCQENNVFGLNDVMPKLRNFKTDASG